MCLRSADAITSAAAPCSICVRSSWLPAALAITFTPALSFSKRGASFANTSFSDAASNTTSSCAAAADAVACGDERGLPAPRREKFDAAAASGVGFCSSSKCGQHNMRRMAGGKWAEKLRETEELFRTTVENLPINLVLYDRDYRILYMNPALAAICAAICRRTPGRAGGHARRRAVAAADLGSAVRAHRARGRDARAPDLRAGHQPARARPVGARVDGGAAGRPGGRGRSHPDHEPRRHRAAADGRGAARGRSAQERVHRRAVPRAAQPAGGDPAQPARARARRRRAATRRSRRRADHRPAGRPAGPPGRRSARRHAHHAEQDPAAAPAAGPQRAGARDHRGQPRHLEQGGVRVEAGLATRADLRRTRTACASRRC